MDTKERLRKALKVWLWKRLPNVETLMPQTEKEVDVAIAEPKPGTVDHVYKATLNLAVYVKVPDTGNEIANMEHATDMAVAQYSEYLHQPVIEELAAIRKQVLSLWYNNTARVTNSDYDNLVHGIVQNIDRLTTKLMGW